MDSVKDVLGEMGKILVRPLARWRTSPTISGSTDEIGQVQGCPGRVCYDRNPYSRFCGCLPIIRDQTKKESSPRCSISVGSCVVDDSALRTLIVRQKNCLALATCSDYERGARRLLQTMLGSHKREAMRWPVPRCWEATSEELGGSLKVGLGNKE